LLTPRASSTTGPAAAPTRVALAVREDRTAASSVVVEAAIAW
jgi:hypothetical protein